MQQGSIAAYTNTHVAESLFESFLVIPVVLTLKIILNWCILVAHLV